MSGRMRAIILAAGAYVYPGMKRQEKGSRT